MQVKCEVFSRFGSSVDFSSDEPLGGVEAPTVGADLCVRPYSPERSLFCGRTRRSAHMAYNALTRTGGHIGPPLQRVTRIIATRIVRHTNALRDYQIQRH